MELETVRLEFTQEHGTFGALRMDKLLFCWTLEPYGHALIPPGRYWCERVTSPLVTRLTRGLITETFEITGVPGRSLIRIHPGNSDDDTEGCTLVGETLGKLRGTHRAILNSGATFRSLMAALDGYDGFPITILEAY